MTVRYYYNPGYFYPYYSVGEVMVHNDELDTDMGDMRVAEFFEYFPKAFEITEEQFNDRSIDSVEAIRRAWGK